MNNKSIFGLTRSQQAVFKMGLFNLSGHQFYLGGVMRLKGMISLERLVRVADRILNTQDVFRIGFINNVFINNELHGDLAEDALLETESAEMKWFGIRHDSPQIKVEKVDFSKYPDPKAAFEHWAKRQLLMEEDLSFTPLRIFAVRFQQDQSGCFLKAHHAALDGMSLAILQDYLIKELEQEESGSDIEQTEPSLFSASAEEEQNYEHSRRIERDAAYWQALFGETASVNARNIACRYPIGDYRGLEPRSLRIKATVTESQNKILSRFKNSGGSIFRLFFTAVAYTQMVIEDGNCALLQAPIVSRWSETEKRSVSMGVAPILMPVFRQTGQMVADCYRILKKQLQKAIVHSRYAPATRWGELASPDWKRIIPAFGVSYQTGEFQKTVAGAEITIDHIQAVESLFATIHIHDRFENGCFVLEADFRKIWSPEQCHAFLQAALDYAIDAAVEVMGQETVITEQSKAKQVEEEQTAPIGVHLLEAFECHDDSALFKSNEVKSNVVKSNVKTCDLTYRQGLQWISQLRGQLRDINELRVEHKPVLILGRRTPETLLAYLACLIENVTVVPVCSTTTPTERLLTIIRNSGVSLCIYTEADQNLAEALGLPLLRVSLDQEGITQKNIEVASSPEIQSQLTSCNPAYILYTSGSTGEPKGVAISPFALANYALAAKAEYADKTPFSMPLFTSFGFDLTQTAILVPVLSGGFIQTHEQDIRDNPELLRSLLADESLTGAKCTPSHLSLLIEHGLNPKRRNPLTFIVGGENLPASLVNKALDCLPLGSKIINEYGPTEATVGCCIYSISNDVSKFEEREKAENSVTPVTSFITAARSITAITPIGTALGKAKISIRDSWGQIMPRGFSGEIWISGPILADGYLNNSAQTEANFVCSANKQHRWYRTGDLGMQDEQGIFHCLGRIDDEFKVRGHRIHPVEIEKAVEDVLIQLGQSNDHGWQLKALKLVINEVDGMAGHEMIVLCSNQPVPHESHEFQNRLKEKIAESWLPNLYCTVQPWPMNANGKVDIAPLIAAAEAHRKALIDAAQCCLTDKKTQEEPENYLLPDWLDAEFLRPIWPQSVDLTASFLEQGGDSIKAIRLVALLAKKDVRIGVNALLTPTALGAVLEKSCVEQSANTATDSITLEETLEELTADWLQYLPSVRWFQHHRFKHSDRLQQGVVLELSSSLPVGHINAAVVAVKAKHKIFSLRANQDLSEFYFLPSARELKDIEWETQSRRKVLASGEHLENRLERLQGEVCLAERPSVHEVVLDPVANKYYLIWVCHHLICDVHSWIFLLDELDQALGKSAIKTNTVTEGDAEQGAFLWGKWLADKLLQETVQEETARENQLQENLADVEPSLDDDTDHQPATAPIILTLSVSNDGFKLMEQDKKASRSSLIAAALLEVIQDNGLLPRLSQLQRPSVLFENHGRLFSETQMPAAWNSAMANAVGWFTGFQLLQLHVTSDHSLSFLQTLKTHLHEDNSAWKKQLGLNSTSTRPLICINDIGFGLGNNETWQHINLVQSLSGGFRHPDEKNSADFDILIHDCRESGSILVELRLGISGGNADDALNYLTQLNDRLSAWCRASLDELHDGQSVHCQERSLVPADFPLCQLSQSELDFIIHGASV
ncbi:AMP-binding protein [Xenorhabdus sp. XENO-10]|uniref:AMP-binding protein n=1 Tax=Xenorhabdus yunnanensis TaxID=3025878 RepID=A0ABT5LGH4_9GAMM|nr:AMP-binding protein [Xenorhabdus yunnanensis]MDC9589591.1 AMP-binding protein [Xenorhabdus yunnanensis]